MTTFTKKSVLFLILLTGSVLAVSPARAQLGAAVGYGLNMLNEPSFSSSASNTFEGSGGLSVGLFYSVRFGRLEVRPGLFLQQTSMDWTLDEVEFSPLETVVRTASIPLDVLFYFPLQQFSPYVVAGPALNFLHTDQPDLRQVLNRSKGSTRFASLNLGVGIEVQSPRLGLRLLPEIRYSYALSGFLQEEYIIRTVPFAADGSPHFSSLTFRLGISFLSIE